MVTQSTLNIMVIDDEHEILDSFKDIFENSDFNLFLADNAQTAIDEISKNHYHIAFIDIFMPEMDGIETLQRLKQINPNLIAVMISGFRNEDMLENALKLGASNYLYKPLDIQSIFGITLKLAQQLGIQNNLEFMLS